MSGTTRYRLPRSGDGADTGPQRWRDQVVPYPPAFADRYGSESWGDATIPEELARLSSGAPDALAVFADDATLSFRELDDRSTLIAAGLLDAGLVPGDTALLQLDNEAETVVAWYGLLKAGVIPVCTLSLHRAHELRPIGETARPRAHFIQAGYGKADLVALAQQLAGERGDDCLVVVVGGEPADGQAAVGLSALAEGIALHDARRAVAAVQGQLSIDDVAVFQLSGGTSGVPKIIPRLHGEYWHNAVLYARALGWDAGTRAVTPGPLVHNAGIVCAMHSAHSAGGALVLPRPGPGDALLEQLIRTGATDLMMVPSWVPPLLALPAFDEAMRHVRRIVLTGAPVPEEIFAEFEQRDVRALGLFGMGEGLVMVTRPEDAPHVRLTTVGRPLSPLDEVRVLDPDSEEPVPAGEVGELCCRGPYTLRGYLAAPERNAEAFTSDGFYRSGDLTRELSFDGLPYYTYEGRIKDLVNRGGEKINAPEVEALLVEHPSIAEAALVPMPDPRLGERPCAYIRLVEGATLTLEDVQRHFEAREVAKYKWPERLEFADELPKTPVGKIDKKALHADIATRLA